MATEAYGWIEQTLTVERLRQLLPEARGRAIARHPLANLLAVNVVIKGLLSEGVSSSKRSKPQAKALGECLHARVVEIPEALRG
jgi:hypothetical protein